MSIKASGTEPMDTLKYTPREMKKIEPKEIKVFNPPKQVHGEYIKRDPREVNWETKMNSPMKESLKHLPDNVKKNLTPEMNADIEAGMTTKNFIDKYKDALAKNMGL